MIFDFDGTLVDSEHIASLVFTDVWTQMGYPMTQEFFIEHFVGIANDSETLKPILSKMPANASEIAHEAFHKELERSLKPVTGVAELLADLKLPMCVASNSFIDYIYKKLKIVGLEKYFGDRVFSGRDVPKPKPAPDVFLHAADTLGFTTDECIVVEDSFAGVTAAKAAGMTVIGFTAGLHFNETVKQRMMKAQPDYSCATATELKKLILELTK